MERIALKVEYDGTNYCGWQRQPKDITVQEVIEDAISKIQKQETIIYGSGRTDAGVHAYGQVAHFDSVVSIPADRWKMVLNDNLPEDIRIVSSVKVDDEFHARYLAKDKTYKYVIYNSRVNTAINRNYSWFVPYKLDIDKMKHALTYLIGEHDFFAFMSTKSSIENTVREIYEARLVKENQYFTLYIRGNGFLHNMVRIIAGTLVDIGRGKLPVDAFKTAIESRNRDDLGDTAKAQGLFLMEVTYFENLEEKLVKTGRKVLT